MRESFAIGRRCIIGRHCHPVGAMEGLEQSSEDTNMNRQRYRSAHKALVRLLRVYREGGSVLINNRSKSINPCVAKARDARTDRSQPRGSSSVNHRAVTFPIRGAFAILLSCCETMRSCIHHLVVVGLSVAGQAVQTLKPDCETTTQEFAAPNFIRTDVTEGSDFSRAA